MHASLMLLAGALLGCADGPSQISRPAAAQQSATKFWDVTASTRWNRRVAGLLALRPPGNGQAATSRILTYLSVAQYRAVLAAEDGKNGSIHPSVPAAVGAASVAVLSKFFPQDANTLEGQLDADLAAAQWPGTRHEDVAAGEAIGRAVGAEVNALAATDNYLVVSPGTPPPGPGYWVSSSAPIVRSLTGVRPFFLTSASQLRPPPPPAFGSPAFLTALAEVRAISDARTAEQLAIARFWNTSSAPFTAGALNLIADDLIEANHRTEREAARILAYANAAAFDAQIACFDAKFEYWFIRPSQADPAITLPIGLPNHPSYPSGHSCITSAITGVLAAALPSERSRLEEISELAGMSRVYGGIHYRFDIEAGQAIGRGAAELALSGSLR
ncbi:MAG TPA: vanadium-dependent haloperoxidase [Gemmatimonadaceae bacterium]|nr:vanadium-dependent haloperoxidase [Gemmatimonadaceae bacterium]